MLQHPTTHSKVQERNERWILRTIGVIFIFSYLMQVLGLVGQNRVAVKPYQPTPGGCFLWLWDGPLSLCSAAAAALRTVDSYIGGRALQPVLSCEQAGSRPPRGFVCICCDCALNCIWSVSFPFSFRFNEHFSS